MNYKKTGKLLFLTLLMFFQGCLAEEKLVSYEKLSAHYLFLLYFKESCPPTKREDKETNCLPRPLLVEKNELDSGQVEFLDENGISHHVKIGSLSFLPSEGSSLDKHAFVRTLELAGYSDGNWNLRKTKTGNEVTMMLVDGRHGRTDIFTYYIEDDNVVGAKNIDNSNVFDDLFIYVVFFVIIISVCFFWVFRSRKSRARAL